MFINISLNVTALAFKSPFDSAYLQYAYLEHCIESNYWLIEYFFIGVVCAVAITHFKIY